MADLSDVTAMLAQLASDAVYPSGSTMPGVAGSAKIFVAEGWPVESALSPSIATGDVHVTVFPMRGAAGNVPQYLPRQEIVTPAVHGLVAVVDDAELTVTVSGAPSRGEFLTITLDESVSYSRGADTIAGILSAIESDAAADYPDVSVVGSVITFPSARSISASSGAPAVAGVVTHRQKSRIMVTTWAPDPALRAAVAAAVDVKLKANLRLTLPDGSQAILRYADTFTEDARINVGIYRRDLIYEAEYATLDTYEVVEVTSFGAALDVGPGTFGHVAGVTLSSQGTDP